MPEWRVSVFAGGREARRHLRGLRPALVNTGNSGWGQLRLDIFIVDSVITRKGEAQSRDR